MSNKVLVVEDSPTFRHFLTQQLVQNGYEVFATATFAETVTLLETQQDFLCAVLDYCLPDAENGEVIALALQQQQRVIVLSATFKDETRDHFIQQGVLDYILKDSPSWGSELLALIYRLNRNKQHHALVVDDSALVRNHLSQLLEHQYIRTSVANDGVEALELLKQHKNISFIIADHSMPNMDGITLTREIRQKKDRNVLPILGLSGSEDPTMTARFLKAGANDFLYKPFNQEELYCRIHYLLGMKEANDSLYRLANQDDLTGLWNRRYFFRQGRRKQNDQYIALVDIDFFKRVNDEFGHDCGDQVIKTVANVLKIHFENAVVARYGGEEFCIKFQGDYARFISILEKMRSRIEGMKIPYQQHSLQVTVSIGATKLDASMEDQLIKADNHLYCAKQQGRNRLIHD